MPAPLLPAEVDGGSGGRPRWLEEFHAGSKQAMTQLYADHFAGVERSVGRVLHGADRETVIRARNTAAVVELGVAGVAAASGVVLLFWPQGSTRVDVGASASSAFASLNGRF
jgi:type IV secretory pathway TrbD component